MTAPGQPSPPFYDWVERLNSSRSAGDRARVVSVHTMDDEQLAWVLRADAQPGLSSSREDQANRWLICEHWAAEHPDLPQTLSDIDCPAVTGFIALTLDRIRQLPTRYPNPWLVLFGRVGGQDLGDLILLLRVLNLISCCYFVGVTVGPYASFSQLTKIGFGQDHSRVEAAVKLAAKFNLAVPLLATGLVGVGAEFQTQVPTGTW